MGNPPFFPSTLAREKKGEMDRDSLKLEGNRRRLLLLLSVLFSLVKDQSSWLAEVFRAEKKKRRGRNEEIIQQYNKSNDIQMKQTNTHTHTNKQKKEEEKVNKNKPVRVNTQV